MILCKRVCKSTSVSCVNCTCSEIETELKRTKKTNQSFRFGFDTNVMSFVSSIKFQAFDSPAGDVEHEATLASAEAPDRATPTPSVASLADALKRSLSSKNSCTRCQKPIAKGQNAK